MVPFESASHRRASPEAKVRGNQGDEGSNKSCDTSKEQRDTKIQADPVRIPRSRRQGLTDLENKRINCNFSDRYWD